MRIIAHSCNNFICSLVPNHCFPVTVASGSSHDERMGQQLSTVYLDQLLELRHLK